MTYFRDLVHPAAGTALISEWITGTDERTRAAADAVTEEWAAGEWPPALLSQHVFRATDGTGLLFYAQWTSDEEHLTWARARRGALVSRVDTLVPGIQRPGLHRTRLHRSVVHDDGGRPPGALALTRTTPDTAPGLLAAHIHRTENSEEPFVIEEWTDAASFEAAVRPAARTAKRYTLHHSFLNPHAG
ncbi:Antibiotic biosynthesis monooxygenase [Streptomyces sp. YIM 121038]|uniref:antibiotic biosynthesis monooxygenase n=1 Tax=Streptomyces sp. YIM 121038 TaxID=2136401 RepID=UPI00110FFEC0|nr:antibiotic biosynthesis monooxygenase [Streptomyces sp. YIM 121038]QCX77268.1 Antibiotic biosynthesis monooxygenase [Streptomyces sp. YIM 121038]